MKTIVIYVSGAFTASTKAGKRFNTRLAISAAIQIIKKKHSVIVPHLNTGLDMEEMAVGILEYNDYIRVDIELLKRSCDACYFLPNWKKSKGAMIEMEVCKKIVEENPDFQIYFHIDDIPDIVRGE